MAEKNRRNPQPKGKKKKVWESPRVKSGRLFESNSLACGKNSPMSIDCRRDPEMS